MTIDQARDRLANANGLTPETQAAVLLLLDDHARLQRDHAAMEAMRKGDRASWIIQLDGQWRAKLRSHALPAEYEREFADPADAILAAAEAAKEKASG